MTAELVDVGNRGWEGVLFVLEVVEVMRERNKLANGCNSRNHKSKWRKKQISHFGAKAVVMTFGGSVRGEIMKRVLSISGSGLRE